VSIGSARTLAAKERCGKQSWNELELAPEAVPRTILGRLVKEGRAEVIA